MKTSFQIKTTFRVPPSVIYSAWLDSEEHTEMTGGEAQCSDLVGGRFSTWDGYIKGSNVSLKRHEEIVQRWRTTEFADSDPDSLVTIRLSNHPLGCQMILEHTDIPDGQPDYEQGWMDYYITPMTDYFDSQD